MACFIVPVIEAVAVTVAVSVLKSKEKNASALKGSAGSESNACTNIPLSRKLQWLANLLWGGSFLLAYEHLWHGEVVPWFPFLTAMSDAASRSEMLHEMSTVGVAMSLLVTSVWAAAALSADAIVKRGEVLTADSE